MLRILRRIIYGIRGRSVVVAARWRITLHEGKIRSVGIILMHDAHRRRERKYVSPAQSHLIEIDYN